ncbi:MAG: GTP-binding protein, partial [Cyanobacteria bacterium P01_H01_bin.130]
AVLETGPLNGVTRVARSLEWELEVDRSAEDKPPLRVELVDTPGLDEIEGEGRAAIAWEIADSADLILFVVAGDITHVESQALRELRTVYKPLILVFNKIDLYPEADHKTIANRLKALMQLEAGPEDVGSEKGGSEKVGQPAVPPAVDPSQWKPMLPVDEVVLVAAEPAPLKVREEWPDGRVTYGWESPPPNVTALKTAIRTVVEREGDLLLAFNALFQARLKEKAIAQKTITHLETGAESKGWQIIQLKAILVALSPAIALDLVGGLIADSWMIWRLTKLYGLPLTTYGSKIIGRSLAISSAALAIAELLPYGLVGNGPMAIAPSNSFGVSVGVALCQGLCAAWGSKKISQATRDYLENGCTWSSSGSDTVARQLINESDQETVIQRLRARLTAPPRH